MARVDYGGAALGGLSGAASGAAIGSIIPGIGTALGAGIGGLVGLFGGGYKPKKEKIRPQSVLRPEQEALYNQAVQAGLAPGAGGAFGEAADYYRSNLGNNPADFEAFAAPERRQFYEQTIPNLSEQFAGMGAGGLSSSGFQNASIAAGTDLSERLGALRANLRQQSAQGLSNIGQLGLRQYSENVRNTPQAGFGENLAEGIGYALPSLLSSYINRPQSPPAGNKVGQNTGPYGNAANAARSSANVQIYGR
jgi:hypothetical protein